MSICRKNKVFPSAKDRLKAVSLKAFSLKSFSLPEGHYVLDEVHCMKVALTFFLVFVFVFSLALPVYSEDSTIPLLEEIRFVKESDTLERIIFKLNGTHIPKIFAIKGDKPRVVFDFIDVRPSKKVKNSLETKGNLVRKIRVGVHGPPKAKTRVVFDLVPKGHYDFDQDFNLQEKSLSISVFHAGTKGEQETPPAPVVELKKNEKADKTEESVLDQDRLPVTPVVAEPQDETRQDAKPIEEGLAEKKSGEQNHAVVLEEEAKTTVTQDSQMPVSGPVLSKVSFDDSSNKGEMVLFKLNDFHPPLVFGVEEGLPRVVCDFMNARLGSEIEELISSNGQYIDRIRVATHKDPDKIRVVLDLVPNKNYDLQQVFFKEDNLFVIIVNSYNDVKP